MSSEIQVLLVTAATVGFVHTVLGPDHYLPFVMMSRAGRWSLLRTAVITVLCGIGHVLGSVALGLVGVILGISMAKLEFIEGVRGDFAAWGLVLFGVVYGAWGLRKAYRNRPHTHWHTHSEEVVHSHEHIHEHEHVHVHQHADAPSLTPWILFTVFVFGPCEPLIPLLMYPAAQQSWMGLFLVTGVFAVTTISTMLAVVLLSTAGVRLLPLGRMERATHALAGGSIALCGLAILFLGL